MTHWQLTVTAVADANICDSDGTPSGRVTGRERLAHAAWTTTAIAVLGWWSWYSDPDPSLPEIMASPASYEGQEIKIGDEPVLESADADSFMVRSRGYRFRVTGTVSQDDVGRFIYVRGVFQRRESAAEEDGRVDPAEYYVARDRRTKIWLSVIPVIWVGVLLLRHFRINTSELSVEPGT